jgi:hypothetical protein
VAPGSDWVVLVNPGATGRTQIGERFFGAFLKEQREATASF